MLPELETFQQPWISGFQRLQKINKRSISLNGVQLECPLIPHSHQKLNCLKSGVST